VDEQAAHEQHIIETCQKEGGGRSYVLDPENAQPSYCVTYAWSINFDLPEMIAFGTSQMALRSLAPMFDGVIDLIEAGTPLEDGQRWPILENGQSVVGRFVHASHLGDAYFADARFCRGLAEMTEPMPVYQLFWPDDEGRFPWDAQCDGFCRRLQPLLFEPAALAH
jgi:hypothetical protein